jgi:CheY-like chemotaxis protein
MTDVAASRPADPLRVLIVEDSALVAMHLEEVLAEAGCEIVGILSRVGQAAEAVGRLAPDVALLDINLHGEKVFSLARQLQERHIPIVFSSGYARPALPRDFAGAPYISKPFEPEDLLAALRSAAGTSR